ARSVPHGTRGRVPRPPQPVRERVLRAGPGVLLPADRRPGRVAADDLAGAGGGPPATSGVPGLLRRLLAVRRPGRGEGRPGPPHEALGGRAGGTHRRRLGGTERVTACPAVGTCPRALRHTPGMRRAVPNSHASGTPSLPTRDRNATLDGPLPPCAPRGETLSPPPGPLLGLFDRGRRHKMSRTATDLFRTCKGGGRGMATAEQSRGRVY